MWTSKCNIGFFHKEKAVDPGYQLRELFIDHQENKSCNKQMFCKIKIKFFNHFLFKNVPNKFKVRIESQWRLHEINFLNNHFKYVVLGTCFQRPIFIGLQNQFLCQFTLEELGEL